MKSQKTDLMFAGMLPIWLHEPGSRSPRFLLVVIHKLVSLSGGAKLCFAKKAEMNSSVVLQSLFHLFHHFSET